MTIGIITDSTCDLPSELAEADGIEVVPLSVNFGVETFRDGIDITREDYYRRLATSEVHPTTAQPAPGDFKPIYEKLVARGVTEILSIHVSETLSAVVNSARLAAQDAPVPVTVHDSGQLTLGLGLQATLAARLAAEGKSMAEIVDAVKEQGSRTWVFAGLDTMEYLKRSGRVSTLVASMGGMLQIKPLLIFHQGEAKSERIRTDSRMITRLISLVEALGPLQALEMVHVNDLDKLHLLREKAAHLLIGEAPPLEVNVTPVIGTHVGPGTVAFTAIAAR